jgi:hypothetical protein
MNKLSKLAINRSTMTYLQKMANFRERGQEKSTGTNITAEKEIKILLQVANTSLLLTSKSQPLNYCYGPSSNFDTQTLSHTYYHHEHLKASQELYLYMEYCGGGDLGTFIKT